MHYKSLKITGITNLTDWPKHIIIVGDFNLPEIDWEIVSVKPTSSKISLHQLALDIVDQRTISYIKYTSRRLEAQTL